MLRKKTCHRNVRGNGYPHRQPGQVHKPIKIPSLVVGPSAAISAAVAISPRSQSDTTGGTSAALHSILPNGDPSQSRAKRNAFQGASSPRRPSQHKSNTRQTKEDRHRPLLRGKDPEKMSLAMYVSVTSPPHGLGKHTPTRIRHSATSRLTSSLPNDHLEHEERLLHDLKSVLFV